MTNSFTRFIKDDEGQDLIEYALVGGLVAVGAIAAIDLIGDKVAAIFDAISKKLPTIAAT